MHASDLQEFVSLVDKNTSALDAARVISRDRLAGLVVANDTGVPVAVVSAVDVLGLLVPGYILEDMSLAGVFDEHAAEEIWSGAQKRVIGELLDDDGIIVRDILVVEADSSLVEIAAQMVDAHAQIALVKGDAGARPAFLLLPTVMDAILAFSATTPGADK